MLRNHRRRRILVFLAPLSLIATAGALGADGDGDTSLRNYHSANGLLNRGLHELAITEYRKFLSQHGSHAKAATARYGLGICLYRLGRFGEAADELSQLEQLSSTPYEAEVAVVLGQCYLAQQQYAHAASQFDVVVENHVRHDLADDAAAGAAEAFYRNGQFDQAMARCRLLGKRWPKSPLRERTEFFWGLSAMELGDYKTAQKRLANVLEDFGSGPFADQASILFAQCHHHRDLPDRAVRAYRKVLDRSTTDYASDALFGLGMLAMQNQQWKESGEFFERLIAEHPDSPLVASGRFYCAQTWFDRGEPDRALALFQQSVQALTGTALEDDTAYWVAKCKLRQERFAEAAKGLDRAIEAFPKSDLLGEMYYDRAICLVRGADADGGIKALGEFLGRFPKHVLAADALHLLAATEHRQRRFDKSQEHCRTFFDRHESHDLESAIAFLASENLFLVGKYSDATKGYRRFLGRFPDDEQAVRARYRLGSSLYMLERLDEAKPLLEEAVALAGVGGLFRFSLLALGDIHFQAGEWMPAEDLLGRYLASVPDAPSADDALLKLGLALQRQGKHEEAILAFDRLLKRFDQSSHRLQALFERGQVLVALGRGSQAKEAFELVLTEGGESRFSSHALNHLGSLAMQGKNFEAAATFFEDAGASNQDSTREGDLLYQRGRALMADGRLGEAETAFAQLLDRYPSHRYGASSCAQLAIARSRQDRYDEALETIERVEQSFAGRLEPSLLTSVLYEKAWCLRSLGRTDEAATVYRGLLAEATGAAGFSLRERSRGLKPAARHGSVGGTAPGQGERDIQIHALLDLAGIEVDAKRYESAAKLLRRLGRAIAAYGPRSPDAPRSRGVQRSGATGDVPEDVRSQQMYQLAICEFNLEHFEEAVELFTEFLDRPRGTAAEQLHTTPALVASASFFCGEAAFRLGRHRLAVTHLTRVVEKFPADPTFGSSLLRLGECLAELQHWPLCEQVLGEYLERFGRTAVASAPGGGRLPSQSDQHGNGDLWFQARFGVGWARENQGRYDEAIRAYEKVVLDHKGPTAARAQFQIGECLFAKKDYQAAAGEFLKVDILYAYPKWSAAALFEAGVCFEKLSKPVEARTQFKTVAAKYEGTQWAKMASIRLAKVADANPPGR